MQPGHSRETKQQGIRLALPRVQIPIGVAALGFYTMWLEGERRKKIQCRRNVKRHHNQERCSVTCLKKEEKKPPFRDAHVKTHLLSPPSSLQHADGWKKAVGLWHLRWIRSKAHFDWIQEELKEVLKVKRMLICCLEQMLFRNQGLNWDFYFPVKSYGHTLYEGSIRKRFAQG